MKRSLDTTKPGTFYLAKRVREPSAQMELRSSLEELERKYEALQQEDAIKTLERRNVILFIITAVLGVMLTPGVLNYILVSRKKIIQRRAI